MEQEFDGGGMIEKRDRGITIKRPSGATTVKDVIDLKSKFDGLNKRIDGLVARIDRLEKKKEVSAKSPKILE